MLGHRRLMAFLATTDGERGRRFAPDGAWVAWFKDPDGNVLSVTQS